jgi:hypothetical protein
MILRKNTFLIVSFLSVITIAFACLIVPRIRTEHVACYIRSIRGRATVDYPCRNGSWNFGTIARLNILGLGKRIVKCDLSSAVSPRTEILEIALGGYLEEVDLSNCDVDDETIYKIIAVNPGLRSLRLNNTAISGAALSALRTLPLEELGIDNIVGSDNILDVVASCPTIRRLSLSGVEIDQKDWDKLRMLPKLDNLCVSGTSFDDEALHKLAGHLHLKLFVCDNCDITDSGLAVMSLRAVSDAVSCIGCKITRLPTAEWESNNSPRKIALECKMLSTGELMKLRRCSQLRHIILMNCTLDKEEISSIVSAMPDCYIETK